jgi:succinate dehydrogenase / fumarate reductase cytochrome b subunit
MNRLKLLLSSGIGRKMLMAFTGLALIGFLVTHLSANMLILFSKEAFNEYGHALTSNPLIYIAEFGLLAIFVGHFITGFIVERGKRAVEQIVGVVNDDSYRHRAADLRAVAYLDLQIRCLVCG